MGNKAYVLIETAMGRSREVTQALEACEWIERVERVAGPYDIVAVARGDGFCDFDGMVNNGLGSLDGVIRIVVCPVSSFFDGGLPAIATAAV